MTDFTPSAWYWHVGGDLTQAYSSASGAFVPAADATFQAWLAAGNQPTRIDSASNLGAVLAPYGLRPVDIGVLAGYQQSLVAGIDVAELKALFNHENRIRALEGKTAVTAQQFTAAIAALM